MEITIKVSDTLGQQLQRYQNRLPELLERGLRDVAGEGTQQFHDENAVLEVLVSQPSPEQVLALQASPQFQMRVSALLDRGKHNAMTSQEEAELERYLVIEHLVRLAKAHAYKVLAAQK